RRRRSPRPAPRGRGVGFAGPPRRATIPASKEGHRMSVGGVGGGASWDPADYADLGPEPPGPADPAATLDPPSASMATLRPGATGQGVRDLQTKLNASRSRLGLPLLPVNGNFGPQTERAVVTFQKLWGLAPDAVVGPATW